MLKVNFCGPEFYKILLTRLLFLTIFTDKPFLIEKKNTDGIGYDNFLLTVTSELSLV